MYGHCMLHNIIKQVNVICSKLYCCSSFLQQSTVEASAHLSVQTPIQRGLRSPVLHANSVTQTHTYTQMSTLTTLPKPFVQIINTPNRTLQKLIKNEAEKSNERCYRIDQITIKWFKVSSIQSNQLILSTVRAIDSYWSVCAQVNTK